MTAMSNGFLKATTRTFHEVYIGPRCFRGEVTGHMGLLLFSVQRKHAWRHIEAEREIPARYAMDWNTTTCCAIGRAVMCIREDGWAVCKYGPNEPHIRLPDLTEPQCRQLAAEFGLEIRDGNNVPLSQGDFYASPSYKGLVRWVGKHPRMASAAFRDGISESFGVRNWHVRATTDFALANVLATAHSQL